MICSLSYLRDGTGAKLRFEFKLGIPTAVDMGPQTWITQVLWTESVERSDVDKRRGTHPSDPCPPCRVTVTSILRSQARILRMRTLRAIWFPSQVPPGNARARPSNLTPHFLIQNTPMPAALLMREALPLPRPLILISAGSRGRQRLGHSPSIAPLSNTLLVPTTGCLGRC